MIILGLNAFHADSAACLLRDGELVAAVEEERFQRIKHWAGYPERAIAYCLAETGATIEDVDVVAINSDDRAAFWPRLAYLAANRPGLAAIRARLSARVARASMRELLSRQFPRARCLPRVERVEHHLAHLYSTFAVSPFDEAVVASIDGFGDFASAAWGVGRGDEIAVEGRILFPHSLGIFYQALTQYLGFPAYGDEYKVMGLAPYGEPRFLNKLREVARVGVDGRFALNPSYFRHPREAVAFAWNSGSPEFADLFTTALERLLGPRRREDEAIDDRFRDIAASTQALYEEVFFGFLNALYRRHRLPRLALAGGCAMNSVANGKVSRQTPFVEIYVPPAPGDAGGAIGAALVAWRRRSGARSFTMDHAFWGPKYDDFALARALARLEGVRNIQRARASNEVELCRTVATSIAEGQVVGWLHGRMEWGPRALGARSILCDPRRADMKVILNAAIKKRESFRPFAPSVLSEETSRWFETDGDSPFMSRVVPVRPSLRARVPAITHVNGAARPQTVDAAVNPRFHALISAFRDLTGVPMLLNTSFNENEPIVCTPDEAVDCFARTNMDLLVLGDFVVRREAANALPRRTVV
jgi:carbamoyltransferase